MTLLAIAVGGAIGSLARHAIAHFTPHASPFPVGITIVNVSGCFVIGLLAGLVASGRLALSLTGREFVFVGLLGGYTTFSTFGLDIFVLLRSGAIGTAMLTAATQVVGGLLAVWVGYSVGAFRI